MSELTNKVILCAGVVLALLLAGLISTRHINCNSLPNLSATSTPSASDEELTEKNVIRVDISNLPDIEYVPIYPSASFLRVENESAALRLVGYVVDNSLEEVTKCYDENLRERGWVLRGQRGYDYLFTLKSPTSEKAWQLWLRLTIGATSDPGGPFKTLVSANYGRYPDTNEGLPVYGDAHDVEITRTLGHRQINELTFPAFITDVTYLTSAPADTIADFYTTIPRYGWFYDNPSSPGPQTRQTDSITSEQGLTFSSSRNSWNMEAVITSYLSITSAQQKNGQLLVKLHIEEIEAALPDY